ncbi:unnamed protein product [Leuciscus chuanchicus]
MAVALPQCHWWGLRGWSNSKSRSSSGTVTQGKGVNMCGTTYGANGAVFGGWGRSTSSIQGWEGSQLTSIQNSSASLRQGNKHSFRQQVTRNRQAGNCQRVLMLREQISHLMGKYQTSVKWHHSEAVVALDTTAPSTLFTVIHAMENVWDERVYQRYRQSLLEIPEETSTDSGKKQIIRLRCGAAISRWCDLEREGGLWHGSGLQGQAPPVPQAGLTLMDYLHVSFTLSKPQSSNRIHPTHLILLTNSSSYQSMFFI